jgi:23S rRNA C2498 (ribose-2'-O)-methylase RlmM
MSEDREMINVNLPPDVEFHEDIRLLVYRPRGLIDEAAINKIIAVLEQIEAATQEPFNRFSDASEAHEVELNFRYVIQVSLHRRLTHKGRAQVKSAILASDSTIVHYARLVILLTEGSSIKVRVFQNRNEAAQWLGVPIELLTAKASSSETSS